MYVKDHMTKEPVTITKDVKISKAVDIMSKGHFHRLPIVDEAGKLIGLVTGGLVTEKSGANATSLSIYELNYLLSKTKVEDIMLTDVKTIHQDAFIEEAAQKMLDEFDLGINATTLVGDLSIAQQQMVEIVKAISFNCRILVMDEPTSSISDREVAQLFEIMRGLAKSGVGIIYISHKMSEGCHHRLDIESCHLASLFRGVEDVAVLVLHVGSILGKLPR